MRQADALDAKAGAMVGLHAVAAGILASILGKLNGGTKWVVLAAIVGLLLSGWFALRAYRAESYDRSPSPDELWRFGDWTEDEVMLRFLSTRFAALEHNRARLDVKARSFARSLSMLGLIALVLSVTAVVDLVAS
jgi:hypothetical protein